MVCLCSESTRDRDWRVLARSSLRINGKSRQSIILNCETWIWSLRCWEGEQFIYLFYVEMVLVWCDSCSITFQILLNRPIFDFCFIPSCLVGQSGHLGSAHAQIFSVFMWDCLRLQKRLSLKFPLCMIETPVVLPDLKLQFEVLFTLCVTIEQELKRHVCLSYLLDS